MWSEYKCKVDILTRFKQAAQGALCLQAIRRYMERVHGTVKTT